MSIKIASALVLTAWLAAPPARAEVTETYRAGLWTAYQGHTDSQIPFCGVATSGGESRRVAIQQYPGVNGVELRLSKDGWNIPRDRRIALQIQFDDHPRVAAQGVGNERDVAVGLSFEQSVPFMQALREGRVLRVAFPEGSETVWTGGLAGSSNAINAFNNCRQTLAPAPQANPTQPFLAPNGGLAAPLPPLMVPPTQPFAPPLPG